MNIPPTLALNPGPSWTLLDMTRRAHEVYRFGLQMEYKRPLVALKNETPAMSSHVPTAEYPDLQRHQGTFSVDLGPFQPRLASVALT